MLDKVQLKAAALTFGQAFQNALKVCAMYSIGHPSAEKAIAQSYKALESLLQHMGLFTLGFLNQRVLINNMMTDAPGLNALASEFAKREVAAVSFLSGMSQEEYKRGLALLSTRPKAIQDAGGLRKFLKHNPLEAVRIMPLEKPKGSSGDFDLEIDPGAFLTAQGIFEPGFRPAGTSLDQLLSAAAAGGKPGSVVGPKDLLEFSRKATESTLADKDGDLRELLQSVAGMLAGMKMDAVFAAFPSSKQPGGKDFSPQQIAVDWVEDTTVQWATRKLEASAGTAGAQAELEEVLQALQRGLKATQVVERMLQKLARSMQEAQLPAEMFERIRREVIWFALPSEEKLSRLMQLQSYDNQEFRHLLLHAQERVYEGRTDQAKELANHYLPLLRWSPSEPTTHELERLSQLVQSMTGSRTLDWMHDLARRLSEAGLEGSEPDGDRHTAFANCLLKIGEAGTRFEQFDLVLRVGKMLRSLEAKSHPLDAKSCSRGVENLLGGSEVERIIDLYLQRRDDPAWARTTTALLQIGGEHAADIALKRLEDEPAASNRMQLIRLISRMGRRAIDSTWKRLSDSRWYVVRNACFILGELNDPDLAEHLRAPLGHSDLRVQQAALTSLIKSNAPRRAEVLGDALPRLHPRILDLALEELSFHKEPSSIRGLEIVLTKDTQAQLDTLRKALGVLGAIPSERAVEIVGKIMMDARRDLSLRKAAEVILRHHPSAAARKQLARLERLPVADLMVADK